MTSITQTVIGAAMRTYRRSPMYPAWGRRLARVLAKVPGAKRTVTKEIDGITFELDLAEVIDASLYYSGEFEAQTEKVLQGLSKPGRVALDVGANMGYHTFRMARGVGPTGRVIALEPMTSARTRLERNLALNPQLDNITVLATGVSDRSALERVAFESSYRLDDNVQTAVEEVRLLTIDDLVGEQALPRVDLMKIDVDGFEGKVIRGAVDTLRRWTPDLVFEISPGAMRAAGDDPFELLDALHSVGYDVRHEDGTPIDDPASLFDKVGDHSINLVAIAG